MVRAMNQPAVTSKGQVTIPKEVRQQLGIRAGSRVSFRVVGDHVEMKTVSAPAAVPSSGFGMVKSKKKAVPPDFDAAELVRGNG